MACSHYVSGSAKPVHWTGEPHAVVNLKLDFDGGITLLTGASDIGQGSSTLLAQVVAEVLRLGLARIRVIAADSALTPKDNGSYSSRVSFMVGNAALAAARELKKLLDPDVSFEEAVRKALSENGPITTRGTYTVAPELQGGKFRGAAVVATSKQPAANVETAACHADRNLSAPPTAGPSNAICPANLLFPPRLSTCPRPGAPVPFVLITSNVLKLTPSDAVGARNASVEALPEIWNVFPVVELRDPAVPSAPSFSMIIRPPNSRVSPLYVFAAAPPSTTSPSPVFAQVAATPAAF